MVSEHGYNSRVSSLFAIDRAYEIVPSSSQKRTALLFFC
jgi:hypothetical protein